jgi:ABC-type multidrug transport system fused ATPase/permease subunit
MDKLLAEFKKMNKREMTESNRHKEALFAIAAPIPWLIAYALTFLFLLWLGAFTAAAAGAFATELVSSTAAAVTPSAALNSG